jgi:SsrA-binding protein
MSATIVKNKKAYYNYEIIQKMEAGIVLVGTEVKSIRNGRVQIADSYADIKDGELFLLNLYIAPYSGGNIQNHDETRMRKLLLNKKEINRLIGKLKQKNLTLIPLRIYWKNNRVKIELGLAKGKKMRDKREESKKKDADREIARALKGF